jgi:hypothetical protein
MRQVADAMSNDSHPRSTRALAVIAQHGYRLS